MDKLKHDRINTSNQIEVYLHCGLCVAEVLDGKAEGHSPASYANYSVGWTLAGLQVWCERHQCNIVNIDFEGNTHPAVTGREPRQ